MRPARGPAARRRLLRDARIGGGEVSFRSLPLWSLYSITSSARASSVGDTARSRTARHGMKLCVLTARQAHREHRALARLARHGHIAAHHARKFARDGEAEPCPAVAACGEGIGLGEILKQFRLLLRCHSNAAVNNGKLDPVASVRHLAYPQRDLAFFRELAGIAQEIEQNLLEPHG